MSIHTGRIGTPPQKGHLHIENDTILAALLVLVVALVFVWLVALTMQSANINATPAPNAGQAALYKQRAQEWEPGASALAFQSRSLSDQRTGEWSAGVLPVVMGSRTLPDQRVGEWSVGTSAFTLGQFALHEQRVGEWSTGQTQPASIPQIKVDTEWLNRQAQARVSGIR